MIVYKWLNFLNCRTWRKLHERFLDGEHREGLTTIHAEASTCHSTQPSGVHPHWEIVPRDNLAAGDGRGNLSPRNYSSGQLETELAKRCVTANDSQALLHIAPRGLGPVAYTNKQTMYGLYGRGTCGLGLKKHGKSAKHLTDISENTSCTLSPAKAIHV